VRTAFVLARHGRALNRKISYDDVKLIKEMNMNAVRMSHYPPDKHFLEACDELGLYVLDELAGWQKSYDAPTGRRLIGQIVRRDRKPSEHSVLGQRKRRWLEHGS
jgi:beta-galactosidase/beta-glucuronidase